MRRDVGVLEIPVQRRPRVSLRQRRPNVEVQPGLKIQHLVRSNSLLQYIMGKYYYMHAQCKYVLLFKSLYTHYFLPSGGVNHVGAMVSDREIPCPQSL